MGRCWRIELLGHFHVSCAARTEPVAHFSKKGAALLAYLALHPGAAPRDVLAALFWADSETPRKSLSMALNELRQKLGDDALLILTRDAAELNSAAFTTDAADFEAWLDRAARSATDAERIAALESAVALYGGPFLPACVCLDSPEARHWAAARRDGLIAQCFQSLLQLAELLEAAGRIQKALGHALRALELAPQNERLQSEARKRVLRLSALTVPTAPPVDSAPDPVPPPDAPDLRGVMEASLAALPEPIRVLLSRLSVFRGGWTAAMAAEVHGAPVSPAALQKLQAGGFILPTENSEPPRWIVAAAFREAAFARLSARERRRLSAAHARRVCAAVQNVLTELYPANLAAYLARIDAERPDIEVAIHWTLREGHHPALGSRLVPLLQTYCHETNRRALLREWLELALTHREHLSGRAAHTLYSLLGCACLGDYDHQSAFAAFQSAARYAANMGEAAHIASAFDALGVAAHHAAQDAQARAAFEAGLAALPDAAKFDSIRGSLLSNYAVALSVQNEPGRALALLEQSLALAERAQNGELQAINCSRLAELRLGRGEAARAQQYANQSLEFCQREPGTRRRDIAECLRLLGEIHLAQAHYAEARHLLQESAAICAELDKPQCRAAALGLLGDVEFQQGRLDAALPLYEEGFAVWKCAGHLRWQAIFLLRLARVAHQKGDNRRTAALCDAALIHCAATNDSKTRAALLRLREHILPRYRDLPGDETKISKNLLVFQRLKGRLSAEKMAETLA